MLTFTTLHLVPVKSFGVCNLFSGSLSEIIETILSKIILMRLAFCVLSSYFKVSVAGYEILRFP